MPTHYDVPRSMTHHTFSHAGDKLTAQAAVDFACEIIDKHTADRCRIRKSAVYFVQNMVAARDAHKAQAHWTQLIERMGPRPHGACADFFEHVPRDPMTEAAQ